MRHGTVESARILVVDDEPAVCQSLAEAIRAGGLEVYEAGSAAEAVEVARRHTPDLLVTDLCLPDGTGLDVIDRLRAEMGDVPAIVISGRGDVESFARASRRQPVELINKPINVARLRQAIADELDRQARRSTLLQRQRRLRYLARQANRRRRHDQQGLLNTCRHLTLTCRGLQGLTDRQEALLRYQTGLLAASDQDEVFRDLFRLFVERTGMVFGGALMADESGQFQLVGRFGVPIPDGLNFCRALSTAVAAVLIDQPEVTVLDATDNLEIFPEDIRPMLVGINLLLIPFLDQQDQLIGAIVLYRKGEQPFTDDDLSIAEMIAPATVAAILKAA